MGQPTTETQMRVSAQRQSIAKQIDPGPHAAGVFPHAAHSSALKSQIAEVGRSAPKLAVRSYPKKLTKLKNKLTSPPKKLYGSAHPQCINDFKLAFKSFRQSESRATKKRQELPPLKPREGLNVKAIAHTAIAVPEQKDECLACQASQASEPRIKHSTNRPSPSTWWHGSGAQRQNHATRCVHWKLRCQ